MNANRDHRAPRVLSAIGGLGWLGVIACLICGCAHTKHQDVNAKNGAMELLPPLTAVAIGPAANLLAGGTAFQADFTITVEHSPGPLLLTGRVFARDGKLCWTTIIGNHKTRAAGGFEIIWDASAHQGFVSSEALQGYAPLYEIVQATNPQAQVVAGAADRLEGHPLDHAEVTFQGPAGQTCVLEVARATDLGNLPLQIHSLSGSTGFTLNLANIQTETPPDGLFLPPDGFTRFASEQILLDELAARQHTVFTPDDDADVGTPGVGTHRVNDESGLH